MDDEEKIREILKRLNEIYEIRVFHDRDPYRVLVRTILSQRTKDENTDKATNALFEVFPDIHAVANAPIEEVEQLVRQAGFYRVKSRRIIEVSQILIDQYGGEGKQLAAKGQERVFDKIENFTKPVIAAVNGFALGGGLELAMAAHFRIASTNAKLGLPEVTLGLIPGYGGTQRLPKLIGKGRAMQAIMTAEMFTADRAEQIGLE